jgi:hypothetical protein
MVVRGRQAPKVHFPAALIRLIPTRERTLVDRFRESGVRDPEALADMVERSFAAMLSGKPFVSLDDGESRTHRATETS